MSNKLKYFDRFMCLLLLCTTSLFSQTKVACIGNSITEGGNPGYVQLLGQKLGSNFEVRNYGVSGRTMLKNGDSPYWNEPQWQQVQSWNPDVVTIMLGTNDSKPWNWDDHKDEFITDYREMVEILENLSSNPKIMLVLPPHAGEESFSIRGSVIKAEQIPQIIQLAGEKELTLIDINTPTQDKLYLFPDEVHPNNEGHELLADVFYESISNLLQLKPTKTKLLWYGNAPQSRGREEKDKPWVDIYPAPDSSQNPAAVLICPGGGYSGLALDHEGKQVAEWFNQRGFYAFVLHYRLGQDYQHPVPLTDAQRALRIIRHYANDWGIDSSRIGVLGFSAGGHLASSLGTHFDEGISDTSDVIEQKNCRPDFMALIYPVITMTYPYTHGGSRDNLLGSNPSSTLVDFMSSEKQVTENTPICFLTHGTADDVVPIENSEMMDSALSANSVEHEFFIDTGKPHGYGLDGLWPEAFENWMRELGVIPVSITAKLERTKAGNKRYLVNDKWYFKNSTSNKNSNYLFDGIGRRTLIATP